MCASRTVVTSYTLVLVSVNSIHKVACNTDIYVLLRLCPGITFFCIKVQLQVLATSCDCSGNAGTPAAQHADLQ